MHYNEFMAIYQSGNAPQLSIDDHNKAFRDACSYNNRELANYLLTSPDLKQNVDIHFDDNTGLINATSNGHLDLVKFLLTSPELKEHANLHTQNGVCLMVACDHGHLELVKYFLTSPELTDCGIEFIDVHCGYDESFRNAFYAPHVDIIEYLIWDYKIDKTKNITHFLEARKFDKVEKMFLARDLAENLPHKEHQKKIKI